MTLAELLASIRPPDANAAIVAQGRLDQLTKPPGSLGRLEEIAVRLAAVRGAPPTVETPVILTLAADHGVAAEGVSAYPQSVTTQMVENFLAGGAAINVLARQAGARLVIADFGVVGPIGEHHHLIARRRGSGTANLAIGPAMTPADAVAAIDDGARLVLGEISAGADLVGIGEMGIANTTAASAIVAALTGADAAIVTGAGTGVDAAGIQHKVDVIRRALAVNRPDPGDPLDVLAKVGGFEIAGLVGVILGAAAHRVPVALDGFISSAAALVAVRLAADVRHALFASHRSAEPGHAVILNELRLTPYLELSMRLGEGTGAALFVHLARAAARVYAEMATFKSAGVDGRQDGGA